MVLSDLFGGSVSVPGGIEVCGGSGFLNRFESSAVSCVSMVDGVQGSLSPLHCGLLRRYIFKTNWHE